MKCCELFRAEDIPVFQNKMFTSSSAALACPKGNVVLVQDTDTGLVFNAAFDAGLLTYGADYQNEQACSGVFQRHLTNVKEIIDRYFAGKPVIEVGCGKGYFLEHLRNSGYQITGIDPAYEGDNPHIIKAPFEAGLGLSAGGIVLRHVLEHMKNPVEFLSAIAHANGGKGLIYIEVPCFDWICHHRAWFDIFYEHVNYFRHADFTHMFGVVHERGHLFGGQYLYVVADLGTLRVPHFEAREIVSFPKDFLEGIRRVSSFSADSKHKAIWGGASKGMIFALYMKRVGVDIDVVIDINPAKQGRFLAGSGLRVCSPEEGLRMLESGDDVFVMNSNYLDEIIALSNNQFNYLEVDHDEF